MTAALTFPAGSALRGAGRGVALLLVLLGVLGMHVLSGGDIAGHQPVAAAVTDTAPTPHGDAEAGAAVPPGWRVDQAVGELLAVPHQPDGDGADPGVAAGCVLALTAAAVVLALLRTWRGAAASHTGLRPGPHRGRAGPGRSPPGWPRVALCVLRI
jgi:hypothetical protein